MSSERLPGEAGVVQNIPAVDIVPNHSYDPSSTPLEVANLNIFDRLRDKWTTVAAVGATVVALLVCPIAQQEASAATAKSVEVGMPFDGKWGLGEQANEHTVSGTGMQWAQDLFANGSDAKLNVSTPDGGALSFKRVSNWTSTCQDAEGNTATAGEGVKIEILLDGASMGVVSYAHLDGVFKGADKDITNGMSLGKTKKWGWATCYKVNYDTGVHTHFEARSDSGNFACYYDRAIDSSVSSGTPVARLGKTSAATTQKACTETAGSGGGTAPAPPPAPVHYADYTIYRYNPTTSTGLWYAKSSSHLDPTPVWGWVHGSAGDKPIAADFDGDGYDDYGIYRVINGTGYWYVRSGGSGQPIPSAWGVAHGGWNQDIPVAGDFDGDGKADFGIYRMEPDSTGRWYVKSSKQNNPNTPVWGWVHGSPGDIPVVGDFNGDNVDDYGIYRNGTWYIRSGGDGNPTPIWGSIHGGWSGDQPIVGDFTGDNIDDFGIYRAENGTGYWYVKSGHNGQPISSAWGVPQGGWSQDIALAGDFGRN